MNEEPAGQWEMNVNWLDTADVIPNPENPNEQDDATFNALVASIEQDGWTTAASVVWRPELQKYEIVAGEHRWRAAMVLGHRVPCIVLPPDQFDEDHRAMMLVKDNVLTGKLNPEKFARLYERLTKRYDAEVVQQLMGFTSADAFARVYRQAKAGLPKEMQDALEAAKGEIKTIDDLSRVLNRLFSEYGETLPSNFMVFTWGGREVMWIRASRKLWDLVGEMAKDADDAGGDLAADVLAALERGKVEVGG